MQLNDEDRLSYKLEIARAFRKKNQPPWMVPFRSKPASQEYINKLNCGVRNPVSIARFKSISDLPDLSELPERCVIKPIGGNSNHGVFVLDHGYCHMNGSEISRDDILQQFSKNALIKDQAVLVEEFIQCSVKRDGLPRDYKFYSFGENNAFIHIVERESKKNRDKTRHFFIREDGTPYPLKFHKQQSHCPDPLILPDDFAELVRLAKKISVDLAMFTRVDLYHSLDGPVFGELTPYPHGGKGYTDEADFALGKMWVGIEGVLPSDHERYSRYDTEGLT